MGFKIGALKTLIVVPNVAFFASGCIMIGLGSYGLSLLSENIKEDESKADEDDKNNEITKAMYIVLVLVGIIQCVVSFLGVCGALADKLWMLKGYAIVVVLVILLQIVSVIMAFVCAAKLKSYVKNNQGNDDKWDEIAGLMKDYSIGIVINCCILVILALSACFLSTKIKQERMIFL